MYCLKTEDRSLRNEEGKFASPIPLGEGGRGIDYKIISMNKKSNYNSHLKSLSQELRNQSTLGEVILWDKVLKNKKTGFQFNRQFAMNLKNKKIIVDFICRKLKLIIEIDGYSHQFKHKEDIQRDEELESLGYEVIRFSEQEVRFDLDNVIRTILDKVNPPATFRLRSMHRFSKGD